MLIAWAWPQSRHSSQAGAGQGVSSAPIPSPPTKVRTSGNRQFLKVCNPRITPSGIDALQIFDPKRIFVRLKGSKPLFNEEPVSQIMYNLVFAVILAIGWGVLHLNGVTLLTNRSTRDFWNQGEFKTARNFFMASIGACALAVYSLYVGLAASSICFFVYIVLSVRRR